MSKTVLKIVYNPWGGSSRDRRELAICEELGAKVVVMINGENGDKGRYEKTHGFDAYYYDKRPLGCSKFALWGPVRKLNTLLAFFWWANKARGFKPDIISGHDYPALFVGWLSTLFMRKKNRPALVYDSHEYELGRSKKRSKLQLWFVKRIEGFLIRRCAFTIIPNDDIADKLAEMYHVKRPVVAKNIPVYWHLDEKEMKKQHDAYCDALGISHDSFIMMFHGGILAGRGIEQMMRISVKTDIPLVLLGNPTDDKYYAELKDYAKHLGGEQLILFHPAAPIEILWKYVGAADLGTVIIPGTHESYFHMLPNKFFENIQSLVPVIVSDFPDIGAIVDKYDIGLKVNPEDEEAISQAILRMRDDRELYARFKSNLIAAKEDLCWENECNSLVEAYRKLLDN